LKAKAARIWKHYLTHRREEVEIEQLPSQFLSDRRYKPTHYIFRKEPLTIDSLGDRFIIAAGEVDLP
jgi:hypothetical protein